MAKILGIQQIQVGNQTVWDTAVAPTKKLALVDEISLTPMVEVQEFESIQGLAPSYDNAIVKVSGEGTMGGYLCYEDAPLLFDSLIKTATPTGTDPYVYAYAPELNTAPTRRFYTLLRGDGSHAHSLVGAIVDSLTISGATGEAIRYEASLVGKNVASDAVESLADRAVTICTAGDTTVSIDAITGTVGANDLSCEAMSFSLELNSNTKMKPSLGQLDPCTYYSDRWDATLELTLEYDTGTVAEGVVSSMLGSNPSLVERLIRVEITDGTNIVQLDMAGVLESAPELYSDADGMATVELTFRGVHVGDKLSSNFFNASVTNGVATQFS